MMFSSFPPEGDPEVMVLANFRLVDHNLCRWLSSLSANFHKVAFPPKQTRGHHPHPPTRLMSQSADRIRNASIFGELPKLAGKRIEANISLREPVFAYR